MTSEEIAHALETDEVAEKIFFDAKLTAIQVVDEEKRKLLARRRRR